MPYIRTEIISFWLEPVWALLAVPYIHTERIPFLVGACPNISDFALHPYWNNLFSVGAYTNIHIFPLHPFFDILKFDGVFSLKMQKSLHRFNKNFRKDGFRIIRSSHSFWQHPGPRSKAMLKLIHPAFSKLISLDFLSRLLLTRTQTQPPRSGLALTGGRNNSSHIF